MSDYGEKPKRTVKLLCPSVSKIVPYTASDDQKLDLGSIARVFGLDPSTLKLNGHFISRGADLVSSSVTWRSLLKFFSSKRLPTGEDDMDALIVDGKLYKSGSKRACNSGDGDVSKISCRTETEEIGIRNRPETEKMKLFMNKKFKGSVADDEVSKASGSGFKRKQFWEDINLFKKLKINEANSGNGERGNDHSRIISSSKLNCSFASSNIKRMRDEEAILAAPCKRIK